MLGGFDLTPFDPSSIPGLLVWLDFDPGRVILHGSDIQGASNRATPAKAFTPSGARGQWTAADPAYGNMPTGTYSNPSGGLGTPHGMIVPWPVTAFCRANNGQNNQPIMGGLDDTGTLAWQLGRLGGAMQLEVSSGVAMTWAAHTNPTPSTLCVEINRTGNTSTLWSDDPTTSVASGTGPGLKPTDLAFACVCNGYGEVPQVVAEVLVYTGILTAAQRKSVMGYLTARYT